MIKRSCYLLLLLFITAKGIAQFINLEHAKEKTCFQIALPWQPEYDVRSDIALASWVKKGGVLIYYGRDDDPFPGEQAYLYNLGRMHDKQHARVLCAASRVYDEKRDGNTYSFITKSPSKTWNVMRIWLPAKPVSTMITDDSRKAVAGAKTSWDDTSRTLLLEFENNCDGISVKLAW
jgi:hypothetical protein